MCRSGRRIRGHRESSIAVSGFRLSGVWTGKDSLDIVQPCPSQVYWVALLISGHASMSGFIRVARSGKVTIGSAKETQVGQRKESYAGASSKVLFADIVTDVRPWDLSSRWSACAIFWAAAANCPLPSY